MTRRHWRPCATNLGGRNGNVHIRERYPYGTGVLTYLARLYPWGPMANRGWFLANMKKVTFCYASMGGLRQPVTAC